MELERTISTKGQIVVPKDVRDQLGLKPGSEIVFEINGDTAVIRAKTKSKDFVEEFAAITPKKLKTISVREIKSILDEQYDLP
jgi:AbrB family looped-hinge helix DNA binding protein